MVQDLTTRRPGLGQDERAEVGVAEIVSRGRLIGYSDRVGRECLDHDAPRGEVVESGECLLFAAPTRGPERVKVEPAADHRGARENLTSHLANSPQSSPQPRPRAARER